MIICGTGHRPNKLGGYGKPAFERLVDLASCYFRLVSTDKVISGMALGWDQAIAVAAIRMKIPVAAYVPFAGQESMWPESSQDYYRKILKKCSEIVVVSEGGYSPKAMQVRNERMVDDSDLILALWNGTSGGTANCVRYAEKKGKFIQNLWDSYEFEP